MWPKKAKESGTQGRKNKVLKRHIGFTAGSQPLDKNPALWDSHDNKDESSIGAVYNFSYELKINNVKEFISCSKSVKCKSAWQIFSDIVENQDLYRKNDDWWKIRQKNSKFKIS